MEKQHKIWFNISIGNLSTDKCGAKVESVVASRKTEIFSPLGIVTEDGIIGEGMREEIHFQIDHALKEMLKSIKALEVLRKIRLTNNYHDQFLKCCYNCKFHEEEAEGQFCIRCNRKEENIDALGICDLYERECI
jgi:hypothetical protein